MLAALRSDTPRALTAQVLHYYLCERKDVTQAFGGPQNVEAFAVTQRYPDAYTHLDATVEVQCR